MGRKKQLPKRTHPNRDFIKDAIQRKILVVYQQMFLECSCLDISPEQFIQAVENTRTPTQFFAFFDELLDRLLKVGEVGDASLLA